MSGVEFNPVLWQFIELFFRKRESDPKRNVKARRRDLFNLVSHALEDYHLLLNRLPNPRPRHSVSTVNQCTVRVFRATASILKVKNLADYNDVTARIAGHLTKLGELCDTGFALAIHIRLTAPALMYQTYSQAWGDHYSIKGYMLSDPVVRWGLTNTGRVEWNTLTGEDPEGVIPAAISFGLTHGWTYSVGDITSRTIAGLTRSARAHTTAEVAEIEAIVNDLHDLTAHFEDFPKKVQDKLRRL
jgi:LuxR family transcriptional regulator